MRRFLAAVQFLTIVPARSNAAPSDAVVFFPVVGALLGAAAGGVRLIPETVLPPSIAAALALVLLIAITGALHEDGLADVFDAFRAGRSRERIHAILKDSRVGTYGAIALVMSLLVRWQAIDALGARAVPALAAAAGASRGVMVTLAYVSRPSGEGIGKAFCLGLRRPAVIAAAIQSGALAFLFGTVPGIAAIAASALVIAAARAYFERRIGGVTGDCLGAVCQISEITMLLIFVCPRFI